MSEMMVAHQSGLMPALTINDVAGMMFTVRLDSLSRPLRLIIDTPGLFI